MSVAKSILKLMFSRAVLKKAFLIYVTFKAKTWDKLVYSEEKIPAKDFQIYQWRNPFIEAEVDTSALDSDAQAKLSIWKDPDWKQDQYLLRYRKGGYIEPRFGWGLSLKNKLIYPSLGFSHATYLQKPGLFEIHVEKRVETKVDKIISLRDTGEENYFHFFNDVLPKLDFLIENGVDISSYTIVVGKKLFEKEYFQFFLDRSVLRKYQWHVQADDFVVFEEAIFCKPFTHTKKYLTNYANIVSAGPESIGSRRIFLTRSARTLRYIDNMADVAPLLTQLKFEIVDASELSLESQIRIFQHCRYLIAIHGAGITNIIFRNGNPLSVLEILQPSPYLPFHYIMLSKLFGYSYDVLIGTQGLNEGQGGFTVNTGELQKKLTKMLFDGE